MTAFTESVAFDRSSPFPLPRERRYPLDLSAKLPELRQIYHESNASIWDVAGEVDVTAIPVEGLVPEERSAAALSWSRRAWLAFADVSESEATLVRACLEPGREADLKFVLAARGSERAVAADAAHLLAERFGGYQAGPPAELEPLFRAETIRRALDERIDFDAFYLAHFVVLATIDRHLHQAAIAATREPTCRNVLERIGSDVERQERAAWLYSQNRYSDLDRRAASQIAENLEEVLRLDVFSGRRCAAFLDPDAPGAGDLLRAEEVTATAGLGSAPLKLQREATGNALEFLRDQFTALGINIDMPAMVD